jgi:hypothetical protein
MLGMLETLEMLGTLETLERLERLDLPSKLIMGGSCQARLAPVGLGHSKPFNWDDIGPGMVGMAVERLDLPSKLTKRCHNQAS